MGAINTILTIVQVLLCIVLIATVLLQSGKSAGLSGAIGGGAETFFGKNKARGMDALLSKITVIAAVAFAVVAILISITQ